MRQTDTRCTVIWCSSAISSTRSSSVKSGLAAIRAAIQSRSRASLPCPPPLPCRRGYNPPVSRFRSTMSLTNFTETRNRAAAARCDYPSSTNAITRSRGAIGCGLTISPPHICHIDMDSLIKPHGNPESEWAPPALGSPSGTENAVRACAEGSGTAGASLAWPPSHRRAAPRQARRGRPQKLRLKLTWTSCTSS